MKLLFMRSQNPIIEPNHWINHWVIGTAHLPLPPLPPLVAAPFLATPSLPATLPTPSLPHPPTPVEYTTGKKGYLSAPLLHHLPLPATPLLSSHLLHHLPLPATSLLAAPSLHHLSHPPTPVEYTTGKKRSRNAIYRGHRYSRDKKRDQKSYWKCTLYHHGYSARLTLVGDLPTNNPVHSHGEQEVELEVHRRKKALKSRQKSSHRTVPVNPTSLEVVEIGCMIVD